MSQYFFNPKSQYIRNNGEVNSLGRLAFYESGTQTLKAVYDQDGVTPISNPVVLDSAGRSPAIKLGEGDYKVVLESYAYDDNLGNPVYQTEYTIDPYNAATGSGTEGVSTLIIPNMAALRAFTEFTEFTTVYLIGYYTPGDLGQGWFNFDLTSSIADDSGATIKPNGLVGPGRWIRSFDEDVVYPQQWGVSDQLVVVNNSFRLLSCFEYVENGKLQKTIVIPEGDYDLDASVSLTGSDTEVIFKRGAKFTRLNPITIDVALDVKSISIPVKSDGIVGTEVGLNIITSDPNDIPVSAWNPGNGAVTMFEKSIGNYNAQLIIDDNYILDDRSIDLEISNIHFINGGSIEYTSTYIGSLTVNKYTFEENLSYIFRNEVDRFLFEGIKTFRAQHFIELVNQITSSIYLDLLQSITRNSGRQAQLIWDFFSTYTFTESFSTNDDYRVSHFIGDDSTIVFNDNVDFGLISNPSTKKIFTRNGGSPRIQQTIYPQWFGMTTDNSDSSRQRNTNAINDAIECALISKFPKVDGNNASVKILDKIIIPTPGNTDKTLELTNLGLLLDLDYNNTIVIDSSANTVIKNVKFDGGDSIGGLTAFVIDTYDMKIQDCEVSTLNDLFTSINNGVLTNVSNNIFAGVVATSFVKDNDTFSNFYSNKFRNTSIEIINPQNISFTNNTFEDCNIKISGNVSNYIVNNFRLDNNSFINEGIAAYDLLDVDTSINFGGHGPCSVTGNSIVGDVNLKTTEMKYLTTARFQVNNNTAPDVTELEFGFREELVLFKNNNTPLLFANPCPILHDWRILKGSDVNFPPTAPTEFEVLFANYTSDLPTQYNMRIVNFPTQSITIFDVSVQFTSISNNFENAVFDYPAPS